MNKLARQKTHYNGRSLKPLCLDRPVGFYTVDSYARIFFPGARSRRATKKVPEALNFDANQVRFLRSEINRLARTAAFRAENEICDLPRRRADARRLIKTVDDIVARSRRMPPNHLADLAAGFEPGPHHSAAPALSQIYLNLSLLREWSDELKKFRIKKAAPSNSDPLGRHFVTLMCDLFRSRMRQYPPAGRTGPFVEALAAAWEDLRLPQPPSSKELITWLGQKVEKGSYRRQREKIPPQKR